MKINVKINSAAVKEELKKVKSQVPFAMQNTLNSLAFNSKKKVDGQIKKRLDRPKAYTRKSIEVIKAKKTNLVSTVKLRDKKDQDKLLGHLFTGGRRSGKAFEGKLRSLGVLPAGKYVVPGAGAKLDKSGNIRKKMLSDVIRYFSTFKTSGNNRSTLDPGVWLRKFSRAEKKKKGAAFEFFVVHEKVAAQSTGKRGQKKRPPEPILLFVDRATYRKIFNLDKTVGSIVINQLDKEFARQFAKATATAKK